MNAIDSLLSKWENYAENLAAPGAAQGLRQAYGVLEDISGQVSSLKKANPGMDQAHPDLKSMLDEIEIMTVTEKFKFNRGDYLA